MKDAFSKMNPISNLAFFVVVIAFSMFLTQPVCLAVSILCALVNALYINGRKSAFFVLKFIIPIIILVSLINPVFNHEGMTIIKYFPWGNPLTLESVCYGAAAAVMLGSVMLWFSSLNAIMTSDKFVYLFGRITPSLSLVLSMTLRFVPRFNAQLKQVWSAQRLLNGSRQGGYIMKIKSAVSVLSVMISWSLENAIETADSMKSRGYGLKGRTSFSVFQFGKNDTVFLILLAVETAVLILFKAFGAVKFSYFPYIKGEVLNVSSLIFYFVYTALMLMPFIINVREEIRWKRLRSAI